MNFKYVKKNHLFLPWAFYTATFKKTSDKKKLEKKFQ